MEDVTVYPSAETGAIPLLRTAAYSNFEVDIDVDAKTFIQGQATNGEGRLETDTYTDPHGYVVNGYHLSDHCPVTIKLRIAPFRERVNKADIVTGSRARKKSTNWKYQ